MHKSIPSLTPAPPPRGGASAGRGDLVVTYDPEPGALGKGLADSALRPGVEDGAAQADSGVGAGVAGTPVP